MLSLALWGREALVSGRSREAADKCRERFPSARVFSERESTVRGLLACFLAALADQGLQCSTDSLCLTPLTPRVGEAEAPRVTGRRIDPKRLSYLPGSKAGEWHTRESLRSSLPALCRPVPPCALSPLRRGGVDTAAGGWCLGAQEWLCLGSPIPSFSVRGGHPFSSWLSFHLRDLSKSGASQGLSPFGKPYGVFVRSRGYTLEIVFWRTVRLKS